MFREFLVEFFALAAVGEPELLIDFDPELEESLAMTSLFFALSRELSNASVKSAAVQFHQSFHGGEDEELDILVPVALAVSRQDRKEQWQEDWQLAGHEHHNVIVVPVQQGSLGHLKVMTVNAGRQLPAKRFGTLGELFRSAQLQNLFKFAQKQDFFDAVGFGPHFEEAVDDERGQVYVLFHELDHAVVQLTEIEAQVAGFVERKERSFQKHFVFVLEWQCEAVNDAIRRCEQKKVEV